MGQGVLPGSVPEDVSWGDRRLWGGGLLEPGLGSAASSTAKSEDMSRGVWRVWGGEGRGGGKPGTGLGSCRWA